MRESIEVCLEMVAEEAGRPVHGDRGGLLAFDVGVGKTFTALAVALRANRDRAARRSVVVVPPEMAVKGR